MKLTLIRHKQTPEYTAGDLFARDGERICVTLEEPWRDANADGLGDTGVSCIPVGTYPWFKRESPKRGYEVLELRDVPGRFNIQVHIGNTLRDTEGCILVGSARGEGASITGSKLAFKKLMTEVQNVSEGTLEVAGP